MKWLLHLIALVPSVLGSLSQMTKPCTIICDSDSCPTTGYGPDLHFRRETFDEPFDDGVVSYYPSGPEPRQKLVVSFAHSTASEQADTLTIDSGETMSYRIAIRYSRQEQEGDSAPERTLILSSLADQKCTYPWTSPREVKDVESLTAYSVSRLEDSEYAILSKCDIICDAPVCLVGGSWSYHRELEKVTRSLEKGASIAFASKERDVVLTANYRPSRLKVTNDSERTIFFRVKYDRTVSDLLVEIHAVTFKLPAGQRCVYPLPKKYRPENIRQVTIYKGSSKTSALGK
jgi:hypothetical protein